MTSSLNLFLAPAAFSFFISLVFTPITIWIYRHFKLLDDPKQNHHAKVTHQQPVPRGGGIPIFISLALAGMFFLGLDKHFIGILAGAAVLALTGIADDIFDLSPYLRIFTTAIAALLVVAAGIGVAYITNPFGPSGGVINLDQPQISFNFLGQARTIWVAADILALVWILWMANIVNWSKGLDGQMPGFVSIAAVFIGLLSLRFITDVTQWEVIKLAAITAGAYAGFLVFNFYPQKIMPGYGGGSLAGFLLAVLAILSGAKVAAMILILAIPTADAAITVTRRLLRGKSPVWGDRGHLHHHLLDIGWSKPQIAVFYWFSTFVLGILTLTLTSTQKLFTIIMVGFVTGGSLLWIKLLKTTTLNPHKK